MFTGIIEETGKIHTIIRRGSYWEIEIIAQKVLEGTKPDDSIAVNGVCLTVIKRNSAMFTVQAVKETIHRTTITSWKPGLPVNLERALAADGRLGGHFVQGHVDGLALLQRVRILSGSRELSLSADKEIMELVVEKGSVALDGISLTVAHRTETGFTVAIIPHSQNHTTLSDRRNGDLLNIETDILGKYIHQIVKNNTGSLNKETLQKWGYRI